MSRRLLAAATFVALVLACASPTLPLPPPEAPEQTVVDAQHVNLVGMCGGALPAADIEVQNVSRSDPTTRAQFIGTIASDCGSWEIDKVFAEAGDNLVVTQVYDNQVSLPTPVTAQ
jgi:hypothetical protein